jgi:hypothetical protein
MPVTKSLEANIKITNIANMINKNSTLLSLLINDIKYVVMGMINTASTKINE